MAAPNIFMRPPFKLPPPSSATISNITATRLPRRGETSMSLSDERIAAETRRCSVAKRLPPPCEGIPVSVPQLVKVIAKVMLVRRIRVVFIFFSNEQDSEHFT